MFGMPFHNYIDVIREQEKLLYRIMKDLENKGESIASSNNPEWASVSRKIGKSGLQEKDYIFPILKPHQHNRENDIRVVKAKRNATTSEQIRGKISHFPFKNKK
jgi:hypothetical protein